MGCNDYTVTDRFRNASCTYYMAAFCCAKVTKLLRSCKMRIRPIWGKHNVHWPRLGYITKEGIDCVNVVVADAVVMPCWRTSYHVACIS